MSYPFHSPYPHPHPHPFWDIVSVSVVFLYLVPMVRYVSTWNPSELNALWGMVGTVALNEGIKYGIIGEQSPRPQRATHCNLWANDGAQGGRPGMPSGHSAHVSFFAGYYLQQTDHMALQLSLLAYAGLVMYARWMKSCHTPSQILSGAVLGSVLSYLVVRHSRA